MTVLTLLTVLLAISTVAVALGRHTLRVRLHVLTAAHADLQDDHAAAQLIVRAIHDDLGAWSAVGYLVDVGPPPAADPARLPVEALASAR